MIGALLGEGQADEAAAVAGHEVDGFRGDVLGGQGQVAFVFAVFVVDHDDHAAGADFVEAPGTSVNGGSKVRSFQASETHSFSPIASLTAKHVTLGQQKRHPKAAFLLTAREADSTK